MKMSSKLFEEAMEWTIAIFSALMLAATASALFMFIEVF